MNRGLPVLDQARGRDFLVLTKRSAASGDENVEEAATILSRDNNRFSDDLDTMHLNVSQATAVQQFDH